MKANRSCAGWYGMTRIARTAFGILLCLFAVAGVASAQVRNSTITGTVADQNGSVIQKASVTVINQDTNTVTQTVSGAAGDYSVPYLPDGTYSLSIDVPGFKTYRESDIVVGTGVSVRIDAKLAVGATNAVVAVKASTAELQTENSSVTGSIGTEVIENVPNITNNPIYYATLSAGVIPAPVMYNGQNLGVGFSDRQQYSAVRINGGMLGTNDIQLDGVPVQGSGWHEATVIPNRDALQEVTVSTNNLSADLGGGQGIISLVTKSGTNNLHGDLYYTLRNEAFNANGLANNLQGVPRGKYRVNEAGGSVGGPVIFPKLFNGRDKVFFFVAFDRLTNKEPFNGFATVPTDLQRQGNYSQTLIHDQNGNPAPAQIYNPFTATLVPGSNQVYVRQPYPNAIVTNPDPYGLMYLSAFPEPNHTPSDVYGDNNYYFSGSSPTTRNSLNTRLDFHFGKNSFYASGGVQNGSTLGVNMWGTTSPWSNRSSPNSLDDNPYAALGDIITLNPTTFVDLHVGVQRVATATTYPNPGTFNSSQYSAYGMPGAVQSLIAISGVAPSVYTLGYSQPLNNAQWVWKNEHQTNYDFNGSITKVIGRWTLKQGVDERIFLSNWADKEWATPSLAAYDTECYCEQYSNVNGSANSSYDLIPQQDGTAYAQAAIGVMGYRLDPGTTTVPALADKFLSFYTENDWKVNRRLTANLGLRYEIQPGPTERHNREYDLDLSVPNPFAAGLSVANQNPLAGMGAFAFSGQNGYSRHLWDTQYGNVSPRVGLAYMLTNQAVLRGGYGRIYEPSNTGFNANALIYGGGAFAGGTVMTPFGTNYNGLPAGRFENQANTEVINAPGAVQSPSLYGNANGGAGVDYFMRHGYQNAYMDQWNLFTEYRFHGWLASAGYVGSKGTHLGWRQFPLNGVFNIPQSTLMSWRSGWLSSSGANDPAQALVPNPLPALVGSAAGTSGNTTISTMQSGGAYLGLLGQTVYASVGSSLYNSMQLQLKHSYSNGLTAQFTYDWSRTTGISGGAPHSTYAESQQGTLAPSGGVDYRNLQNNNGVLGYDVPQRFVAVVTYLSPFGTGQQLVLSNPVARAAAGGWRLGTVVTLQSGQPWGPSCGASQNGGCIPTGQPLQVPKSSQHWYDGSTTVTLPDGRQVTPGQYTFLKWNPDAFTNPIVRFPNGTYSVDQYWNGTTPQYSGALRLPAFQNVNLNITRQFTLREQLKLEFLAEATNLFNHSNFLPSAVVSGVGNDFSTPILVADSSTHSAVGQNGDPSAGTLSPNLMDPRQITFTLRVIF